MPRPLRLTVVNAAFDRTVADPDALLDRYDTLAHWCGALHEAGAHVEVVQRFGRDASVTRHGVAYHCIADGTAATPSWRDSLTRVVERTRVTAPDLVHVNGMGFPALVAALRDALGAAPVIVVQDHAGLAPPSGEGFMDGFKRLRWKTGLDHADAVSFTAHDQAAPWQRAGLLQRARVLDVVESSTTVVPTPRDEARARTGLGGAPLVLWIGRLVPGKDPATALAGFESFRVAHPDARLAMIFQGGTLEDDVRGIVHRSLLLQLSVRLLGAVPHDEIGDYLGAADLFLSASHHEGSGYALLEAMACGITPVVTDIAPHAAITGGVGASFSVGDTRGCADALARAWSADRAAAAAAVKARFDEALSWRALAGRTLAAYADLVDARTTRSR
ncbi:MAG: glycosyltransferase family 4 protein [Vicinamibacterales bacterium]